MVKSELRKKYKSLRKSLSESEIDSGSLAIANQLLKLNIWDKSFYHIFLTIEEQKEVNTEYILNILSGKDKNIVVSRSNFSDYSMSHVLLNDSTTIKKNANNIPEPVDGIPIASEVIDVVFIPLLAFDKLGNRIGYGKGFYDRFLAQCKAETLKIGLSFFEAHKEDFEISPSDIALDYCITPKNIYQFS